MEQQTPSLPMPVPLESIVDSFQNLYFHARGWDGHHFMGYALKQCPFDMQVYQELVFRLRPKCIVQTGDAWGGTSLFFAMMLDLMQSAPDARVITVNTEMQPAIKTLKHPRIQLIEGNSTDPETIRKVEAAVPHGTCMVALGSEHVANHVFEELQAYSKLVSNGSYMVVEDTSVNGHPILPNFGPGPLEALALYMKQNKGFTRDDSLWQRNLFSFHTWLRRGGSSV